MSSTLVAFKCWLAVAGLTRFTDRELEESLVAAGVPVNGWALDLSTHSPPAWEPYQGPRGQRLAQHARIGFLTHVQPSRPHSPYHISRDFHRPPPIAQVHTGTNTVPAMLLPRRTPLSPLIREQRRKETSSIACPTVPACLPRPAPQRHGKLGQLPGTDQRRQSACVTALAIHSPVGALTRLLPAQDFHDVSGAIFLRHHETPAGTSAPHADFRDRVVLFLAPIHDCQTARFAHPLRGAGRQPDRSGR